jgi:TonB family protein
MPDDVLQRSADWRSRADRRVRSCDFAAEFDIDRAPVWPVDDARLEPILLGGPQWIEFAEADRLNLEPAHQSLDAALVVGFDEPDDGGGFDRLQQRAEEPPPPPGRRAPAIGIIGSLGVHLLPLLLLLGWGAAPSEVAAAIPVRLVIEEPPQPPAPEPAPPPASTPLASDEMGETSKTTTLVAPPHRRPPPPQLPQPRIAALAPPPPKPSLPAKPTPAAAAAPRPRPAPKEPPHAGRIPGPEASRDEYLAYLVRLTRQHVDLLPISVIGDRRGETTLSLLVLGDGTIARIAIAQGSGYSDIDARIQQIVAAVRRFPPLPSRFEGPDIELKLRFRFPDAVLER